MTLKERMNKIRKRIRETDMKAIILSYPASTYYVSGFKAVSYSRPIIVLVPLNDKPKLIVPSLDEEFAKKSSWIKDIETYPEFLTQQKRLHEKDPFKILVDALVECDLDTAKIGVEWKSLSIQLYNELKKNMPKARLKDCSAMLEEQRMKKDAEEVNLIKKACELTVLGVRSSLGHVKEGVSEIEINAEGDYAVLAEAIKRYPKFRAWLNQNFSLTLSGPASALPHGVSTTRRIRKGDSIIHSRGVEYEGYKTECERTVFLGTPNGMQRRIFDIVREAQQDTIDAVKPGMEVCELDRIARKMIEDAGYGRYFIHRTGHGIGLEGHERPFLKYEDKTVLEPGMVFSVEPGIYIPKIGGVRHSDIILVTEDEHEVLTKFPKDIEAMTLGRVNG